ncbi:MAG: cation diffusion facilitator family transporter [Candidatus Asgardarchaeia archaeon]
MNRENRNKEIIKVLVIILALNYSIASVKLLYAMLVNSIALMADGIHSFLDGISNILGIVAMLISSKPVDESHPYGHEKFEFIASFSIGFMVILAFLEIISQSIGRLFNPVEIYTGLDSLTILFLVLFVNIFITKYEESKGKELMSEVLIADSRHTLSDVIATISVILSFSINMVGIKGIDPFIAIIISFIILKSGYEIVKRSIVPLSDASVIDARRVREIALSVKGVLDCHKIRSRGSLNKIFIDCHIVVDPNMKIVDAHNLCDAVEKKIKEEIQNVEDVTVHIEPAED